MLFVGFGASVAIRLDKLYPAAAKGKAKTTVARKNFFVHLVADLKQPIALTFIIMFWLLCWF